VWHDSDYNRTCHLIYSQYLPSHDTLLNLMFGTTHAYVSHDSFVRMKRLFRTYEMTHPQVRWLHHLIYSRHRLSHETLLIETCDTTHSHISHDSFIRMKRLIHISDDSIISSTVYKFQTMTCCVFRCVTRLSHVTRLFLAYAMIHLHIMLRYHLIYSRCLPSHDTLLLQMCDTTHSHVSRDSFVHRKPLIHDSCGVAMTCRLLEIIGLFCRI